MSIYWTCQNIDIISKTPLGFSRGGRDHDENIGLACVEVPKRPEYALKYFVPEIIPKCQKEWHISYHDEEGNCVGVWFLYKNFTDNTTNGLYVSPEWRRKGIAFNLMLRGYKTGEEIVCDNASTRKAAKLSRHKVLTYCACEDGLGYNDFKYWGLGKREYEIYLRNVKHYGFRGK